MVKALDRGPKDEATVITSRRTLPPPAPPKTQPVRRAEGVSPSSLFWLCLVANPKQRHVCYEDETIRKAKALMQRGLYGEDA